ncbi:MAG TPA: DUF1232 domain-containing protein [Anaerolineae bacterium]|nr:DUF1232 domain-containing protein [Anaerolineae bacterium]
MAKRGIRSAGEKVGVLAEIVKNAKLVWRLMLDPRIPTWLKAIPPATLLYLLFPIDILPDPILGLGQLDDIAVILLGVKLFIELCPQEIVRQHLRQMSSIPGSYRVVDEEPPASIEVPYRIAEGDEQE